MGKERSDAQFFFVVPRAPAKKRAVVLLNDVRNGKAKFGLNEVNRIADVMFNLLKNVDLF